MLQKGNSLRLAKESRKKQKQRLHQQEALMGQEGRDIDSRLARLFAVHEAHVAKTERNQHSRLKSVTDRLDVLERSQRRVEEQQRLMSEQVAKMMRLVEHTARMTALVLKRTPKPAPSFDAGLVGGDSVTSTGFGDMFSTTTAAGATDTAAIGNGGDGVLVAPPQAQEHTQAQAQQALGGTTLPSVD